MDTQQVVEYVKQNGRDLSVNIGRLSHIEVTGMLQKGELLMGGWSGNTNPVAVGVIKEVTWDNPQRTISWAVAIKEGDIPQECF